MHGMFGRAGSVGAVALMIAAPGAAAHGARQAAAAAPSATAGTVSIYELEPDHLMPQRTTSAYDQAHALFTPLLNLDPQNHIVNGMAQSVRSSQGGRVWTIKIKPGWKFQNGEPVTAHSF